MEEHKWHSMMSAFRGEVADGRTCVIILIDRSNFDRAFDEADAGDEELRGFFQAFIAWCRIDARRGCFSCNTTLEGFTEGGDGIGGFAYVYAAESAKTGLSAAFCPQCLKLGRDEVLRRLMELMSDELGLHANRVQ